MLVRQVEPGQIVQPGKALLSLALAGPTQLVAQVDERFLDQLRPGQDAAVVADAFPGQRFAARLLSLAPAVNAQRGAIEVKFELVGAVPDFLREDMTLSVEVQTGRRESALVLPQSALRPEGPGTAMSGATARPTAPRARRTPRRVARPLRRRRAIYAKCWWCKAAAPSRAACAWDCTRWGLSRC